MSYHDCPPLTLNSARDLIQKFHNLQSDFYTLTHQFGQEKRLKDFIDEGHVGKQEWVKIEDCLRELAANAETRLPTNRNPTQAELQDFVNAYGRFEHLKSELTRIRKQLEGNYFPYHPAGVQFLVIGNQAPRPGDTKVSRGGAGGSQKNLTDHSTASTSSPVSKLVFAKSDVPSDTNLSLQFSSSSPEKDRKMPAQSPFDDDKAHVEGDFKPGNGNSVFAAADGSSSTTNSIAHTPTKKSGRTRRKVFATDGVPSPGAAAKIANHAPHGVGYSPNEIAAGLHLMNERQHLDIIKGLQDHIDEQNEKLEDMIERIREVEATNHKMRGRQNALMERVKELTTALDLQPDPSSE